MPKNDNQNHPKLKNRLIQALDQFYALYFAKTPLIGNKAPLRDNWQHSPFLTCRATHSTKAIREAL